MKDYEKSSIGVRCPGFAMKESDLLDCEIMPDTLEVSVTIAKSNVVIISRAKLNDYTGDGRLRLLFTH
ncbi:hypothetical protein Q3G72_021058 [Acer saccharum]|nr:hypothetical protein Q3G72_021058 [Acer saccharum]